MAQKKIVVTGSPSTGKTSVIKKLEDNGFYCMEEIIRSMTSKEKEGQNAVKFKTNPIVSVADPLQFNLDILSGRIAQYLHVQNTRAKTVFFDRGIPDVLAYMDCFGQSYDVRFINACKEYRYDYIFLMPPWRKIYVEDEQRFENFEESLRINSHLEHTYQSFGYHVIEVPKLSIEERISFIFENMKE